MELRKKQFTYRGQTIEELKKLDVREFSKFLQARSKRSVLRQFNEIEKFVYRCKKKIAKKKPIRTHERSMVIVPQMIGMKIFIHNGKSFVPVEMINEMLGHKLGEFATTRRRVNHGTAGVGSTKGSKAKSKK